MGVPSYFRWLSDKYDKILVNVIEEAWKDVGDKKIPPDASTPNPNDIEFDNLYLDMNSIIHPCSHPENGVCVYGRSMGSNSNKYVLNRSNLKQMRILCTTFLNTLIDYSVLSGHVVFCIWLLVCLDYIFEFPLIKVLDGVAPRAKMNQQRSRRFRAARDSNIKKREEKERIEDLIDRGALTREEADQQRIIEESKRHFDSNCITPGTEFMDKVAQSLRWYVHDRINNTPGWQDVQVIISDASVHGEGEHKIMEFIRKQRELPTYDPNTKHVLYGLDADLIMLGLATHEPHFTILREFVQDKRNEGLQYQDGTLTHVQFQFLRINVLREYLESDMYVENLPFEWDLERALDDFVFVCFFVGNDFLPHLPTLEIREKAIDLLIELYKKILPFMGGYITDNGDVDLSRAEMLLSEIALVENTILERRKERDEYFAEKRRSKKVADSLRMIHREGRNLEDAEIEEEKPVYDPVRLGEDGWKTRYYKDKFDKDLETDHDFIKSIARSYVEGLAWVMKYYYQGCASWTWFYPFHYAPFAGELKNLAEFDPIIFKKDKPFYPFEQLMTVLPAASRDCLPAIYHWYMTDEKSPIIHNYPLDFRIDMNGKKEEWKGVALLPFIDEDELLRVVRPLNDQLTEEEKKRNTPGRDFYMVHCKTNIQYIISTLEEKTVLYEDKVKDNTFTEIERQTALIENVSIQLQPRLTKSINGSLSPCIYSVKIGEDVKILSFEIIKNNQAYLVHFFDPKYPEDHIYDHKLLINVTMPERVLSCVDVSKRRRIKHFGKGMPAQRILDIVNPVRRNMQNNYINRDGGYSRRDGDYSRREVDNRREHRRESEYQRRDDNYNRRDNYRRYDKNRNDYDEPYHNNRYDRRRDSGRERSGGNRSHNYQKNNASQQQIPQYPSYPNPNMPMYPPMPNYGMQMQFPPQFPQQYIPHILPQQMANPYQPPTVYSHGQFPPPQPIQPQMPYYPNLNPQQPPPKDQHQ